MKTSFWIQTLIAALFLFLSSCGGSRKWFFPAVHTPGTCAQRGGIWYKNHCWRSFEDDHIEAHDIDSIVEAQMAVIRQTKINVGDQACPIRFFFPEMEAKQLTLLLIFEMRTRQASLLMQIPKNKLAKESFDQGAVLLKTNLLEFQEQNPDNMAIAKNILATGDVRVFVHDLDKADIEASGILSKADGSPLPVSFRVNEAILGAGTSTITVQGNKAYLDGDLGTTTYHQLKSLITEHPEVNTIVLGQINGSLNDAVNMHTGRLIRQAGLNTEVLASSQIASGGVDLFCAGKRRIIHHGARIGIHSWCCINDTPAGKLPHDHPAHRYQLSYFTFCLGPKTGPDFYFHTLQAAPFDGIHWMSPGELRRWKIGTDFVP